MKIFTIPNVITSLNLLCGCVAIIFAINGGLTAAAVLLLAAAILDFFDGFVARLLKSYSEIGVQLDSLADMVSFGVAPAVMLFYVMLQLLGVGYEPLSVFSVSSILLLSPFLLTMFSALRLAKFNVDTRQTTSFIGLNTPANALFFASTAMLYQQGKLPFELNPWVLLGVMIVFCFLMISEIPMFSFKFKDFTIKKYAMVLIFIATSIILLVAMKLLALPIIVLLYILLSIVKMLIYKED